MKDYINNSKSLKVFASSKKNQLSNWDGYLQLPTTIEQINSTIENAAAKKNLVKIHQLK